MGKIDEYREELRKRDDVKEYLLEEFRLSGPRANLEFAFAYARASVDCIVISDLTKIVALLDS